MSTSALEQINVLYRGSQFVSQPDGGGLYCLDADPEAPVTWSADGRDMIDANNEIQEFGVNSAQSLALFSSAQGDSAMAFAGPHPTAVFVTNATSGLSLEPFAPGASARIGTFTSAGPIAVSPSGNDIALEATGADGRTGIWLTDPAGDAATLVVPEPPSTQGAQTNHYLGSVHSWLDDTHFVYSVGPLYGSSGTYQYRVFDTITRKSSLIGSQPIAVASKRSTEKVVATASDPVRVAVSSCQAQMAPVVFTQGGTAAAVPIGREYRYVDVVGWLKSGALLLLARTDACDGAGSLLSWKPGTSATQLLAQGVSGAAIRPPSQ